MCKNIAEKICGRYLSIFPGKEQPATIALILQDPLFHAGI